MHRSSILSVSVCLTGVLMFSSTVQPSAQDSTQCVRPWAIPDKWQEVQSSPWSPDASFDRYVTQGPNAGQLLPNPDVYIPPSSPDATGYSLNADRGLQLSLKVGDPSQSLTGGWFLAVDVNGAGAGGSSYRTAISTCSSTPVAIDDFVTPISGNHQGPTAQGVADLVQMDPAAIWDQSTQTIVNSSSLGISPRIVPIVAFDPDLYQASLATSGTPQIKVVRILGVFVEGLQNKTVFGRFVLIPQLQNP